MRIIRCMILALAVTVLTTSAMCGQAPPQRPNAASLVDTVQYDYYTIPYALKLSALGQAKNLTSADDAEKLLERDKLEISMSDLRIGLVSDIASRSWSSFEDAPQKGSMVLLVSTDFNDDLSTMSAKWTPDEQVRDAAKRNSLTVEQFIAGMTAEGQSLRGAFSRYASYTINLSYPCTDALSDCHDQRRSLRYKAMSLFSDGDHAPLVIDEFLVISQHYSNNYRAFLPVSLLPHGWQDIPVLHDWVEDHTITNYNCKAKGELCCFHANCGVTKDEFQRQVEERPAAAQSAAENRYVMRPGYLAKASFHSRPSRLYAQEGTRCYSDDPEYCICNEGGPNGNCYSNFPPYPTPPASCMVMASYREVMIPLPGGGQTGSGKYHTWINSEVKYNNKLAPETYDGGPTSGGIWCGLNSGGTGACGYINAWTNPAPWGIITDDSLTGGPHFWNTGFSVPHTDGSDDPICDGILSIQSANASWSENLIPYAALTGPNSNTVVHYMLVYSNLVYKSPPSTISVPGWNTPGYF